MESPAEKYQRMMKAKMQSLQNILAESKYCFINMEDACGDEIYDIFKKAATISSGLLKFKNGKAEPIDERNQTLTVFYELNTGSGSTTILLEYQYERAIDLPQLAIQLNELLQSTGYTGKQYFFDISQDVDQSGLAFTDFAKELALFENGLIWRGRSEYENSEGFEYFWAKLNSHQSKIKIDNKKTEESKVPTREDEKTIPINTNVALNKQDVTKHARKYQNSKKPWWKIW